MKKICLLFAFTAICFTAANAQNKDTSASIKNDTLHIDAAKFKFIKVGETVVEVKELQQKGFWFPNDAFNKMFEGLQEYPAKIANPVNQYLLKFFNIRQ